jgi:hypothetical protein
MSKTFFTEKGWHRSATEDPRNPSFTIIEITIKKTGEVLVIAEEEYEDIESCDEDLKLEGDEWNGSPKELLECVEVYKTLD